MSKKHHYEVLIKWTGNNGEGTTSYTSYERIHDIVAKDKAAIHASSDPAFRGDRTKYNPEELLVSSLSSCHMLWYLHLCAVEGIVVTEYVDYAYGKMEETSNGGGRFTQVTLQPVITLTDAAMVEKANILHKKANELCFIASSVNFPVQHKAEFKILAGNM